MYESHVPPKTADAEQLTPGRNCWRIERADRAAVIVDAADYFEAARAAMLTAQKRIMLIGWDFDARIRFGDEAEGQPSPIGKFIEWLVDSRPGLEVYLLRWDLGVVKSLFRGATPLTLLRWKLNKRIHFSLDSAHPTGASHHQKIVVIDDCLAFCGGIDMTRSRWDTHAHADDDPKRIDPGGKRYGPWHDATTALAGPAAAALAEVARNRWQCATGEQLVPVESDNPCWPDGLAPQFENIDVGIARTGPDYGDEEEVHEIETLYLDLIARARRTIYAESQYFASRKLAEALAARLAEPDGPEIVLINPEQAHGWLEQEAMDTARARLYEALRRLDTKRRLRIYHPFTAGGVPIYVHAKIMVVDDQVLRVGSSNWNNRSLRLDTECDVVVDASRSADAGRTATTIIALRNALLAEHLDVEPETIDATLGETGSLIATIDRLAGPGRSLCDYRTPNLGEVEKFLADNEVLDPEGPDEMFEPLSRRSLFRRLGNPH
ncbi:MAG: phospholipase [Alphaproteobacteria bacterium]|nr:phospholipase [Alphaproteobacteria bacterium]